MAGIIEGEGFLGWSSSRHRKNGDDVRQIIVRVGMTDRDTIEKLHAVTGVGRLTLEKRKDPRREHSKQMYLWDVARLDDVMPLIKIIRPWMSARRGARIDAMIQYDIDKPRIYNLPVPHGDPKFWRRGCRCELCVEGQREAARLRQKNYRTRQKEKQNA